MIADYNGVGKASHVTQKLTDILYDGELAWGCIVAAATMGTQVAVRQLLPQRPSGQRGQEAWHHGVVERSATGGGPYRGIDHDEPQRRRHEHPELGPFIEKYMRANPEISTANRLKMMRLMEYLTGIGCILLAESTQGGAPVVVQQMVIKGELGKRLEEFKQRALELAQIT